MYQEADILHILYRRQIFVRSEKTYGFHTIPFALKVDYVIGMPNNFTAILTGGSMIVQFGIMAVRCMETD
jgi:hypothetical protein